METILSYAKDHLSDALNDLYRITRIPSISADESKRTDVARCAEEVQRLMQESGIQNTRILTLEGKNAHPCVYGDVMTAGADRPTLLLYAHYDVQPIGDPVRWKSSPWEPTVREGRVYARGIVDDKAGFIVHLAAIQAYLRTGNTLPINVKFLVEGEEEIGSTHLEEYIATYADLLKADVLVLSDTHNHDTGIPSITYALRGILAFNVELSALKQSVHSGSFGGPIPNPIEMLSKILGALTDDHGKLMVPGIYDYVHELSQAERQKLDALPFDMEKFRIQAGVLPSVKLYDFAHPYELMWFQPSLTVTAFESNAIDSAPNQIIQSAKARITVRLVPNMDPKKTLEQVKNHIQSLVPHGLELRFFGEDVGMWWKTDPTGPAFEIAAKALELGYGHPAAFIAGGGSIPFVKPFSDHMGGIPCILLGLEDPICNAHSENESLDLGDFEKAIRSNIYLYQQFAASYHPSL